MRNLIFFSTVILKRPTQQSHWWCLGMRSLPAPLSGDCSRVRFVNKDFSDTALRLALQIFQANNDATEVVLNKLHMPLLTRFIRIRPQTWHLGIALRLELFGCRVTGEEQERRFWWNMEINCFLGFYPPFESIRLCLCDLPKRSGSKAQALLYFYLFMYLSIHSSNMFFFKPKLISTG